jgi:hypothetical protein
VQPLWDGQRHDRRSVLHEDIHKVQRIRVRTRSSTTSRTNCPGVGGVKQLGPATCLLASCIMDSVTFSLHTGQKHRHCCQLVCASRKWG